MTEHSSDFIHGACVFKFLFRGLSVALVAIATMVSEQCVAAASAATNAWKDVIFSPPTRILHTPTAKSHLLAAEVTETELRYPEALSLRRLLR